ncbi:DUF2460 domain-containing protein [Pseudomonas tohonis]|uniref:DUF2460 domain-containing protein n=1 Tax=Pseudomonas tohonis TaxID=2725477 RepID=UPI001F44E2B6|nr:DUF2460 domain-containing protein [Pseudomonas tohonis]
MAEFLEERFPTDINYGSGFESSSANQTVRTAGGNEYRSLRHPYVMAKLQVDFSRQRDEVIERIIDLNYRANGMFRGFRVYHNLDHSSNNYRDVPTAFDQPAQLVSSGVYQLMRWYGSSVDPKAARRRIRKPVANSVSIGVHGAVYPTAQWSVDVTTGLVTLAANKSRAIASITKGSSAVLTVGTNTFVVGESVVISGVSGMTQINGLRALITEKPSSTEITVAINSTAFSDYASGGTVQTQPIAGESVTAGFYFDIPMRFDADLGGTFVGPGVLGVTGIGLTEILNP